MQIEHHDLHHEFPELRERIHHLKVSDAHFSKRFSEYDTLDHHIRRIENDGSRIADSELETLKMHRVHLKDELYRYLTTTK